MSVPAHAGDPLASLDVRRRISRMRWEVIPLDLIVQWRRCSLMADHFAAYLSYHFARRDVAQEVLSAALNEVIENLAKFSVDKRLPASLEVEHHGEVLRVVATNVAEGERAASLAARLDRLATEDPEDLFLEQLTHTAENDRSASGLGLITLKKDYGVAMGATFQPVEGREGCYEISFTLDFDVEAIEQA